MLTPYEIFWIFAFPAIVFSWYHIIRRIPGYLGDSGEMPAGPHPKIIFSIAARKLTALLVEPVEAIKTSCLKVGFTNYEIKLVVDEIESQIDGVEVIRVPKDFTCLSKYKARALHYALRFLPNSPEVWTLHLDEDAKVTPQCVVSIVKYVQKGGKPVANGPSVFLYDGNLLTFFAEAQRHWTFYWLMDQVDTGVIHWLNGSNLLIRSDIEQQIGWSFVNCFISEDSRFGYEATKKIGKVFGWHGGLTIETPPASIGGVLKQRMRWFFGSILNLRYVPKARLPRRIYSILTWMNGLILTVFFFILILGIYHEPWFSYIFIFHGLTVTAVFWIGRYEIGVYQNLRLSPIPWFQKVFFHLLMIPLVPIIDFICSLPTVLALIIRPKEFQITAKKAQAGKVMGGSA